MLWNRPPAKSKLRALANSALPEQFGHDRPTAPGLMLDRDRPCLPCPPHVGVGLTIKDNTEIRV